MARLVLVGLVATALAEPPPNDALCFAGADDAPFRNTTFLPPPAAATARPAAGALAARDAWRRLEETLCKTTPCWARTAPHPFGFGSHLSSVTLGALELMRDQRIPAVPLHGELGGPDRHAALVAAARTSRASRQALAIYEASPANCAGANASQSCWFRAFAGGACRRAAEPCCPAPLGAATCYHGRGWHPRNFRNVPRGPTTVSVLLSPTVWKASSETFVNLHAVAQRLVRGKCHVDGVGRPKFGFHAGNRAAASGAPPPPTPRFRGRSRRSNGRCGRSTRARG